MNTNHRTLCVRVAGYTARVRSRTPAVIEHVQRYFGTWWRAEASADLAAAPAVEMTAEVDLNGALTVVEQVDAADGCEQAKYARKSVRFVRQRGTVSGYDDDGTAYVVRGQVIQVAGADLNAVVSACIRLVREALRGLLAKDGWVLLHASCVVDDGGRGYLAFGGKGAGKTSVALQLARARGWAVLANDRVFAKVEEGRVRLLPWPAAAAVGMGLLSSAGWLEKVARHRSALHGTTTAPVLAALADGREAPVFEGRRELKPQLFPDQIATLLSLRLESSASAACVMFPQVSSGAVPMVEEGGRALLDSDTFAGETEDRYPNIFGLRAGESVSSRREVLDALSALPRRTLVLGYDIDDNARCLSGIGA